MMISQPTQPMAHTNTASSLSQFTHSSSLSSPPSYLPPPNPRRLSSISPLAMAAATSSLALSSTLSGCPRHRRFLAGTRAPPSICRSVNSSFNGFSLTIASPKINHRGASFRASKTITMMVKPAIQFIQGTDEQTIPDVRLTKSRDGTNGVATFIFSEPSVFDSAGELGDITGLYMIDEEGVLQSVDVSAKFVNGKPERIEAKYVMRNPQQWDRFMRFMERYSEANGLQFFKK